MKVIKSYRALKLSILFILVQFVSVYGEEISPFVLMTIPKSGSHLTIKALYHMTGGTPVWHTRFPSLFCISPKDGFLYTHLVISKDLEEDYLYLHNLKRILNIRDLRDVCVSMVGHILKMPWPGMTRHEIERFKKMSFDEQLMFVIQYNYEIQPNDPIALQVSLIKIAEQAVAYFYNRNILVCKYENLVGEEGAGSLNNQIEELRKIAYYLNIPELSEESLFSIAKSLYGDEADVFTQKGFEHYKSTFARGQIGSWKKVFKEAHKEAFKKTLGRALIELGYEQGFDW